MEHEQEIEQTWQTFLTTGEVQIVQRRRWRDIDQRRRISGCRA